MKEYNGEERRKLEMPDRRHPYIMDRRNPHIQWPKKKDRTHSVKNVPKAEQQPQRRNPAQQSPRQNPVQQSPRRNPVQQPPRQNPAQRPQRRNPAQQSPRPQRQDRNQYPEDVNIMEKSSLPLRNVNTKANSEKIKYCSNCGFKLESKSGFCSQCGFEFNKSIVEETKKEK